MRRDQDMAPIRRFELGRCANPTTEPPKFSGRSPSLSVNSPSRADGWSIRPDGGAQLWGYQLSRDG